MLYADIPAAIQRLENLLGPAAIRRDHPLATPDSGQPIGPGLRSLVRIVSGVVNFRNVIRPLRSQRGHFLSPTARSSTRWTTRTLIIYLQARSPFRSINQFNERMGLSRLELISPDTMLSTSTDSQTTFRQDTVVTLPAGETFPNLVGEGELVLQRNLACRSTTVASGILEGDRFGGQFRQRYQYSTCRT